MFAKTKALLDRSEKTGAEVILGVRLPEVSAVVVASALVIRAAVRVAAVTLPIRSAAATVTVAVAAVEDSAASEAVGKCAYRVYVIEPETAMQRLDPVLCYYS